MWGGSGLQWVPQIYDADLANGMSMINGPNLLPPGAESDYELGLESTVAPDAINVRWNGPNGPGDVATLVIHYNP